MRIKKKYVVWFQINLAGEITEMCGSDSIQNVDNRKTIDNIIWETKTPGNNQIEWMKRKGAIGFKVVYGTILEYRPITELIRV